MKRFIHWQLASSLMLVACLSSGCARTPPTQAGGPPAKPPRARAPAPPPHPPRVVQKSVELCPSAAEAARLRMARPKPLRDRHMPATAAERVARMAAQLGLYEAKGQWADQVEKALRDCEDR